jgi:hypothetical protein
MAASYSIGHSPSLAIHAGVATEGTPSRHPARLGGPANSAEPLAHCPEAWQRLVCSSSGGIMRSAVGRRRAWGHVLLTRVLQPTYSMGLHATCTFLQQAAQQAAVSTGTHSKRNPLCASSVAEAVAVRSGAVGSDSELAAMAGVAR